MSDIGFGRLLERKQTQRDQIAPRVLIKRACLTAVGNLSKT